MARQKVMYNSRHRDSKWAQWIEYRKPNNTAGKHSVSRVTIISRLLEMRSVPHGCVRELEFVVFFPFLGNQRTSK